jgi:hypothetical protein
MEGATVTAVVGASPTDEPFPFASYAALASARDHRGGVVVYARYLPYGVWWDRLRPTVRLVRDDAPPGELVPLAGVWAGPDRFVSPSDPSYDDVVSRYRSGDGLF